jgi:DNA-directed RNA polymerase subunit omega
MLARLTLNLARPSKPRRWGGEAWMPVSGKTITLNVDYCKKALEKVGNPNILVNLVSKRVRQLNSGGGTSSRPLVADTATLGAADIALVEIAEDKISFEHLPETPATDTVGKRKRRG